MMLCARWSSKVLLAAAGIGAAGVGGMTARGDSIASWNFDGFSLAPTGGVESGSATLTFNGINLSYGGGTTINEVAVADPNYSLSLLDEAGNHNNGKALLFAVSMTDYQSLVVTYATDRTSKGFTTQTWNYSTDGVHFTAVSPAIVPTADFALATVDFSGITALNNAPTVYLEMVLGGASSANDGDLFDNFLISASAPAGPNGAVATPLPSGAAMGGVGLLGWALWRARRRSAIGG
jgi:hypothetical protein